MTNKQTFAKNLKYYLSRSNKNQSEVAEVVGVAKSTFSAWIKGEKYPRMGKVQLLAEYFGIQMSDLIEEKLSEEQLKNNDVLSDIIVRAQMDGRVMYIVKNVITMSDERLDLLVHYLDALNK